MAAFFRGSSATGVARAAGALPIPPRYLPSCTRGLSITVSTPDALSEGTQAPGAWVALTCGNPE